MLALVSLARVASQTPTVSDVGRSSWSHIRPTCAARDRLHSSLQALLATTIARRFAAGAAAHAPGGLVIRSATA